MAEQAYSNDDILMVLQQQCDQCLRLGDTFLNIVVNSQEMADTILAFRDKYATYLTEQGRDGAADVAALFPRSTPTVLVCPDQPEPITWLTMAMAEYEVVHAQNLQMMALFSRELGPRLGLQQVTVTGSDGKQLTITPLLYDYPMFKQALINFLTSIYCSSKLQQAETRIQTASVLPSEGGGLRLVPPRKG